MLFKKVAIMAKEYFPNLKGATWDIPTETADLTDIPPQGAHNGLLVIKLKRKLNFRIFLVYFLFILKQYIQILFTRAFLN